MIESALQGVLRKPLDISKLLRSHRNERRMSQPKLAEAAGIDHSYVSRIESGSKRPTRDVILKLAVALELSETDTDIFLASAGFMPNQLESLFSAEPVIAEVLGLLQDNRVPAEIQDDVHNMISLIVRHAQRAAKQLQDS